MLTRIGLLLLALTGLYGTQSQPSRTNITTPSSSEIPTITLCTLLSKPADYHDKVIRVRARYHVGFEYSYFDDPSCKDYAVETTPYLIGNVVWAAFAQSVEAETKPEVYKKFRKAMSICCPSGWRDSQSELVVTGRFFKTSDEGHDHSGRYAFRIIVNKVERVCNTKTNDPSAKENP